MNLGILVIGYNRPESIKRLLQRLEECYYTEEATLIVSIDYSGSDLVEEVAKGFEWPYGKKIIKKYHERQGLRKHILQSGKYMEDYNLDAMAVFEDDIYPALDYFNFMKQSVSYYIDDDNIAGISLYTHLWNMHVDLPFQPRRFDSDIYFMQFAQSWGQVWIKKQWMRFYKWYEGHSEEFSNIEYIPRNVCQWPSNSWLKYHIRYCIEEKKYFVYPYEALATNLADVGEHAKNKESRYTIPYFENIGKIYNFMPLTNAALRYDAFFENENIKSIIPFESLCIDIYGVKDNYAKNRYWLTSKKYNYKCISSYALFLKPHEMNVIENMRGENIFLYDTQQKGNNKYSEITMMQKMKYYFRSVFSIKVLLLLLFYKIEDKIFKN